MYLAHKENEIEQGLTEHLSGTKQYAQMEGTAIGIGTIAALCLQLHDAGKFSGEFQAYIKQEDNMREKGSVNHSSAGAELLMREFENSLYHSVQDVRLLIELISYTITAHHGIYDSIDEGGEDKFDARLNIVEEEKVDEIAKLWFEEMHFTRDMLYSQMKTAYNEFITAFLKPLGWLGKNGQVGETEKFFYMSCMERLLLSIQIDSDWTDTARAMCDGSVLEDNMETANIYQKALKNYQQYMDKLEKEAQENLKTEKQKQIFELRKEIRKKCMNFSEAFYGIYRLSLPTGAGKTLASLGYALKVAAERKTPKVSHIFYISPFISITEQNAEVIKKAVENEEWVMEHHSNVSNSDEQRKQIDTAWKEPIICTTMIQFLYTLFSQKNKSIRRFHQLKNSVIIVDEAQALPVQTIHTFNLMMNFLCYVCHTMIILCTATQPQLASGNIKRKIIYTAPKDMVTGLYDIFQWFNRTSISFDRENVYTFETLGKRIIHDFQKERTILLILNKKENVGAFFDYIKAELKDVNVFYLTTNLCSEHRSDQLESIKNYLKNSVEKVLIISTNLIEAGVDLSVGHVYRSLAGLDSIAQAAGRCNRNGEMELGRVTVIQLIGDELRAIRTAQKKTMEVCEKHNQSDRTESIIFPEWMDWYYEIYYKEVHNKMDYDIGKGETIYKLLSSGFPGERKHLVRQAFETAGESYRPIQEEGKTVIVPYKDGMDILEKLEMAQNMSERKRLLRKIQRYTVSVYENKLKECLQNGVIEESRVLPDAYVAKNYDMEKGLLNELVLQYY